jgi:hypothetical protein
MAAVPTQKPKKGMFALLHTFDESNTTVLFATLNGVTLLLALGSLEPSREIKPAIVSRERGVELGMKYQSPREERRKCKLKGGALSLVLRLPRVTTLQGRFCRFVTFIL